MKKKVNRENSYVLKVNYEEALLMVTPGMKSTIKLFKTGNPVGMSVVRNLLGDMRAYQQMHRWVKRGILKKVK